MRNNLYMDIQYAMHKLKDETFTEASVFFFQDVTRKLIISAYGMHPNQFSLSDLRIQLHSRKKELRVLPLTELVEHCKFS